MLWSVVERKVGSMLVAAALLLMAAGSAQALTNCDAPIGALAHGASAALTDSTTAPTLTSGSATATCNNGTLVYSGTSCTPGCAAQTVSWGAGCSAPIAASLHTNSGTLTNTAAGYTGTVTATCTNGTLSQSGASCVGTSGIPGNLYCWGGTWGVVPSGQFTQYKTGARNTCGKKSTGEDVCWGYNTHGQNSIPTGYTWKVIVPGNHYLTMCGITTAGAIVCWGQMPVDPSLRPHVPAAYAGYVWEKLSLSSQVCAIRPDKQLYCWGLNDYGQVNVPAGHLWDSVSAQYSYTCGITTTKQALCWGRNQRGQLNIPSGHLWAQIETGPRYNTCGVTTTGQGFCWGYNPDGQNNVPSGFTWKSIHPGYYHACGLTTANEVKCWEYTGNTNVSGIPAGKSWISLDVDHSFTCGLASN